MNTKRTIGLSVIIPAWNEERTLSSIVEIVRTWKRADEIIVVDDGSKDGTYDSIRHFGSPVRIIRHGKNKGKADAMVTGIEQSHGSACMFLDGDTVGLTHKDLDAMLAPVSSGAADMVLGAARFWSAGKFEPFTDLTGQRVLTRRTLLPLLPGMKRLGYGVELYFNKHISRQRTVIVQLPHVFILGKLEKQTLPDALITYIREIRDLLTQVLTQYADEIGPHARRIFTQVIRYIVKMIDVLG